jgi:D-alanyl-D-alanine carboxypeptidase
MCRLGLLVLAGLAWVAAQPVNASAQSFSASTARLDIGEAEHALLPATRDEALPDGYAPPDLRALATVGIPQVGSGFVREIVVPDLRAIVAAARAEGVSLWVASGYRSYASQETIYGYWARQVGPEVADRRSARPGHSQHQLGTAIDFNLGPGFRDSSARHWLSEHAHEYGFVFPYTEAAAGRTGYVSEPWHVRWVGPELATTMWAAGYLESDTLIADDYIALARGALLQEGNSRSDG